MPDSTACPQCGADNAEHSRRCRICANLLDASVPEADKPSTALPLNLQLQVEQALAQQREDLGEDTEVIGPEVSAWDGHADQVLGGGPSMPLPDVDRSEAPTRLSSAEIERLSREAVRQERMKKRPGFLKKVLREDPEEPA